MIRYTTPAITLIVEGADLTDKDVYVTLQQGSVKLTKKGDDLTISTETVEQTVSTYIVFSLTQEESANFKADANVSIQVNWIGSDEIRSATAVKGIPSMNNLLDEVINYGA